MSKSEPSFSAHALDLAQLRAWLEKMVATMRFVEMVVAIVALFTRMRDVNFELTKQLTHLRRRRPRSEKLARLERQLELAFVKDATDEADQERAGETSAAPGKPKQSRKGRHPGRAKLPAHLERIEVQNLVPPEHRLCPICGSQMLTVGHAACETLELVPAKLVVIRRLDERVACPHDDAIVSAPTPSQLIDRGKLGPGLVVEAMADKFLEHLPIERQCLRYSRSGVRVVPQTLGRSVAAAIDLLQPLAKLVYEMTRSPGILSTDNSGIPILDQDAPDGIRTGTMACWINRRWVSFVYSPVGDSDSVRAFLGEDLRRVVQCDGTSLTSFLERVGGRRPGCWAHARRRLVDAARSGDLLALEGLQIIRRLFAIERLSSIADDSIEDRLARRQQHTKPVLEQIRAWVAENRGQIPPKTPMGKALGYLSRQWHRLVLFADDGRLELTNNRVERELRKLILGRKNWLFTWEDVGGERIATILTVIGTAVAHRINPRAYLHQAVRHRVDGWPIARLRELLPDRIAAAHPELRVSDATQTADFLGRDPPLLPAPS